MYPWLRTIANGAVKIWKAAPCMAAATAPVPLPRGKRRDAQLDSITLKDIGVEPGSITWL